MKEEKLVDELLKMLIDLDDFLNGGQSELKEASTKPRSNTLKGSEYWKNYEVAKRQQCEKQITVEEST